jgi:hypothetical protein
MQLQGARVDTDSYTLHCEVVMFSPMQCNVQAVRVQGGGSSALAQRRVLSMHLRRVALQASQQALSRTPPRLIHCRSEACNDSTGTEARPRLRIQCRYRDAELLSDCILCRSTPSKIVHSLQAPLKRRHFACKNLQAVSPLARTH